MLLTCDEPDSPRFRETRSCRTWTIAGFISVGKQPLRGTEHSRGDSPSGKSEYRTGAESSTVAGIIGPVTSVEPGMTCLATTVRGISLYLYLMLDL